MTFQNQRIYASQFKPLKISLQRPNYLEFLSRCITTMTELMAPEYASNFTEEIRRYVSTLQDELLLNLMTLRAPLRCPNFLNYLQPEIPVQAQSGCPNFYSENINELREEKQLKAPSGCPKFCKQVSTLTDIEEITTPARFGSNVCVEEDVDCNNRNRLLYARRRQTHESAQITGKFPSGCGQNRFTSRTCSNEGLIPPHCRENDRSPCKGLATPTVTARHCGGSAGIRDVFPVKLPRTMKPTL